MRAPEKCCPSALSSLESSLYSKKLTLGNLKLTLAFTAVTFNIHNHFIPNVTNISLPYPTKEQQTSIMHNESKYLGPSLLPYDNFKNP